MTTEDEARELVKAAYRPGEDFLSAAIHIITAALAQRDEARSQALEEAARVAVQALAEGPNHAHLIPARIRRLSQRGSE